MCIVNISRICGATLRMSACLSARCPYLVAICVIDLRERATNTGGKLHTCLVSALVAGPGFSANAPANSIGNLKSKNDWAPQSAPRANSIATKALLTWAHAYMSGVQPPSSLRGNNVLFGKVSSSQSIGHILVRNAQARNSNKS
jgi:hypothetical protein